MCPKAKYLHSVVDISRSKCCNRQEAERTEHNYGDIEEEAEVISKPLLSFIDDGQDSGKYQKGW